MIVVCLNVTMLSSVKMISSLLPKIQYDPLLYTPTDIIWKHSFRVKYGEETQKYVHFFKAHLLQNMEIQFMKYKK